MSYHKNSLSNKTKILNNTRVFSRILHEVIQDKQHKPNFLQLFEILRLYQTDLKVS